MTSLGLPRPITVHERASIELNTIFENPFTMTIPETEAIQLAWQYAIFNIVFIARYKHESPSTVVNCCGKGR